MKRNKTNYSDFMKWAGREELPENHALNALLIKLFNSNFNASSTEFKIAKILLHINQGNLLEFIVKEKSAMDKRDGKGNFERYYSSDVIDTINKIYDIGNVQIGNEEFATPIIALLPRYAEQVVYDNFFMYFEASNYRKLKESGLVHVYSEFNSKFRGNILQVHNIKDKYFIIETASKDDGQLYYLMNRTREHLKSHCYDNFEHALLDALFNRDINDRHANTVSILYDALKNEA